MPRALPTAAEAARILAAKRTRPARRPPATAGRPLNSFIKQLDARFGYGPETLQARWREIVGENLAARTEPVKLSRPRNGAGAVLELKVDGPAATLIQHQAPEELLARVNLSFWARRRRAPAHRPGRSAARRRRSWTGPDRPGAAPARSGRWTRRPRPNSPPARPERPIP